MTKKVTYNLNFLAKSIFELDEEYQKILRILATQKDHLTGINQTQITLYFENSRNSLSRRTIHKKLFGTNKKMGLIPAEYVVRRLENKKRYGKDEITFHLTFKGLFGALASGVPLKRIYIYKNFLKVIDHYVKDKKINEIIKKYYELQIQSFLLWHYVYGIQLKKVTTFQSYYFELDNTKFAHTMYFGIKLNPDIIRASKVTKKILDDSDNFLYLEKIKQEKSKDYVNEILNVFSSYFTYKGIMSLLRKNGLIPTTNIFLKPDFNASDTREDFIFDKLINDWPIFIESAYQAKTLDDALFDDYYEIADQPNVTFLPRGFDDNTDDDLQKIEQIEKQYNQVYIPNIENKIKNILKKKKIQIDIPKERASNVYPF